MLPDPMNGSPISEGHDIPEHPPTTAALLHSEEVAQGKANGQVKSTMNVKKG